MVARIRLVNLTPEELELTGAEPVGAEARARQYTDERMAQIPQPIAPTLADLGGEPKGAEQRARQYTDERIAQIPAPIAPTLADLGGEPEGAEARAKLYINQQIASLVARLNQLESDYPVNHNHFWGTGSATNGTSVKTWSKFVTSGNDFCRYASVASPANGDTVEFKFPLKSGNYNLELIHLRRTDSGIVNLYLDGSQIGTIDAYSSTNSNVNRFTASFSVATTGIHSFKAVVAGKNTSSSSFSFAATAVLISAAATIPSQLVSAVRINCGDQSNFTAADGNIWVADNYFTGGVRADLEAALGPFTVSGTQNQRIYKFERSQDNGSFSYAIPIGGSGIFTLKLLFAENYFNKVGDRVGSVSLNGSPLLTNFDILKEVNKHTALVKAWTGVQMPTATVNLTFTNILVNGIELVRT